MSRPQDAIVKLSRGESVEVAQKDGESASGEALPEGWAFGSIEDATVKVGSGATPKGGKAAYKTSGTPLIRSMNVHFGQLKRDGLAFIDDEQAAALDGAMVKANDTLLNITGASIGRVSHVPDDLTGARVNQHVCIIRLVESLSQDFLRYYLSSPAIQNQIAGEEYGVTRPALTKGQVLAFQIPWAPRAEQSRIVSAIESLQERSSRARVLLSEVGPLIGQLRQSVLRDAFSGKLTADWRARRRMGTPESPSPPAPSEENSGLGSQATNPAQETASELLLRIRTERRERWQSEQLAKYEAKGKQPPKNWQDKYKEPEKPDVAKLPEIPDSWEWAVLDTLTTKITDGTHHTPQYTDQGVAFISVKDIRDGRISFDNCRFVSEETHRELCERCPPEPGDILITKSGTIGRTAVIKTDRPFSLFVSVALLKPVLPDTLAPWIDIALRAWIGTLNVDTDVKGTAIKNLHLNVMRQIAIPIPPLDEQMEIISLIGKYVETMETVSAGLTSMESSLTQMDQSILSKAFRGELVPQDPRDEPASELLARIRTAREKTQSVKKSNKKKPSKRKQKTENSRAKHQLELELPGKTIPEDPNQDTTSNSSVKKNPNSRTSINGSISDYSVDEVMSEIRAAMWGVGAIEEGELLKAVSKRLGYSRMSANLRTKLKNHLRAAVRRQIIERDGDYVDCPTSIFRNYEKEFLVRTFKSTIRKGYEYTQEEVIQNVATHLGFSNVTDAMRNHMKPAIKLAIRRKLIGRRNEILWREE